MSTLFLSGLLSTSTVCQRDVEICILEAAQKLTTNTSRQPALGAPDLAGVGSPEASFSLNNFVSLISLYS